MKQVRYIMLTALATLAACGGREPDAPADMSAAADAGPVTDTVVGPSASEQAERLVISSDGIGLARRGMSLGELRNALPASHVMGAPDSAFMVDLVAIPVSSGADTLYRLIVPAGEPVGDSVTPHLVMTMHPQAQTAEGVAPGMTIADAARIYGEPVLSYSVHDESREYAEFPRQPERVRFRVRPAGDGAFAGTYASSGEYNTTGEYAGDARIWMIFVDLFR